MPYKDAPGRLSRLRIKVSQTPGEVAPPDGLETGELALNAADGVLFARGVGGTRLTWQAKIADYWTAYQESVRATIASTSLEAAEYKAMPEVLPGRPPYMYNELARLHDGRVCVFGYDSTIPNDPQRPTFWDTATEDIFGSEHLTPVASRWLFATAAAANGKILCPSWRDNNTVSLDTVTGELTDLGFPPPAQWSHNGTFYIDPGKNEIAITPDNGLGEVRVWNSLRNSISVQSTFNQLGGIRSGVFLPDGRSFLFRGKAGGSSFRAVIYDPWTREMHYGAELGQWFDCGCLMTDGRVLLAPYANPGATSLTPKIYDPATDTVESAAPMTRPVAADLGQIYGCLLTPSGHYLMQSSGNTLNHIYDPEVGIVRTDTDPKSSRAHTPVYGNDGWMVSRRYYSGDRPVAYRAWSGSFTNEVLNSPFFSKWS